MRPRAEWALAAFPTAVSAALIWHAASEDLYFRTGQSHWETHSGGGRVMVVIAVLINLGSAAAILRDRFALGVVLAVLGLLVSFVAAVSIAAN